MRILMLTFFFCFLSLHKANAQADMDKGKYCSIEDQKYNVYIFKNPKSCKRDSTYENFLQYQSITNSDTGWLAPSLLKWFTISKENSSQTDSFVVSRSSVFKDHGFVQVLLDGKHYKIYQISSYNRIRHRLPLSGGSSSYVNGQFITMPTGGKEKEIVWYTADGRDTYLFGTEPNNLTEITRSIFPDIMAIIMADKPEVVKAINKKEFKYGQIPALINYYKTGIIPSK